MAGVSQSDKKCVVNNCKLYRYSYRWLHRYHSMYNTKGLKFYTRSFFPYHVVWWLWQAVVLPWVLRMWSYRMDHSRLLQQAAKQEKTSENKKKKQNNTLVEQILSSTRASNISLLNLAGRIIRKGHAEDTSQWYDWFKDRRKIGADCTHWARFITFLCRTCQKFTATWHHNRSQWRQREPSGKKSFFS